MRVNVAALVFEAVVMIMGACAAGVTPCNETWNVIGLCIEMNTGWSNNTLLQGCVGEEVNTRVFTVPIVVLRWSDLHISHKY